VRHGLFILAAVFCLTIAPARAADYPSVAHLKPYSAETRYMSLPGYLRFLVYQREGIWITHSACATLVERQRAAGLPPQPSAVEPPQPANTPAASAYTVGPGEVGPPIRMFPARDGPQWPDP